EATGRSCPSGVATGPFTARATVSGASPRATVGFGAPVAEVTPAVAPLVDPSARRVVGTGADLVTLEGCPDAANPPRSRGGRGAGGVAGRGSPTPPGSASCCRTSPPGVAQTAVAPPPDTEVRCTTDSARRGTDVAAPRDGRESGCPPLRRAVG